tara:strand:- start:1175 stop:1624 length:450 start_codon:yes stop_codon:yes gene_type:complete
MSWTTAIVAGTSIIAGRQASAAGEYNQAIFNRNAEVKEQEAEIIKQRTEYEIAQFDRKFAALQGQTKTAVLKSGAELSGSGLRILRFNAEQAEIEKDMIEYNSKVGQARAYEEANFARMKGNLARQQARAAEFGYYAQAGTSLLTEFGD